MRRPVLLLTLLTLFLLSACNTFKYVPKDQYLLHSVKLVQNGMVPSDVNYNMSGRDTSKWINRTLRKIGEEPVIFDPAKNERSRLTLQNLMVNQGYFNA